MQSPVPPSKPGVGGTQTPRRMQSPRAFQTPPTMRVTSPANFPPTMRSTPTGMRLIHPRVDSPANFPPEYVPSYDLSGASPLTVVSAFDSPDVRTNQTFSPFVPITLSPRTPRKNDRTSPFSPTNLSFKTTGTLETAETSLAAALRAEGRLEAFTPPLSERPITPLGRKSPHVQKQMELDEAVKKTRLKTELCMHYLGGRPCPFGSNCTYAHGEEELQMTKLMDLHKSGLVDMETYRTRPCWTWCATGSCPFGKRCTSIHDPRVQGQHDSWLTHTETQGNNSSTDINVDALFQVMQHEIHCGTPFGELFHPEVDTWNELYKRIGNIYFSNKDARAGKKAVNNKAWVDSKRPNSTLSHIVKLQIALDMRGPSDFSFKYRPQHIIHGELCMILQKRYFRISGTGSKQRVYPISKKQYNDRSLKDIFVLELAFGPDSDSTARSVALWFNIPDKAIEEVALQQAKRFRWKRGLKNSKEKMRSPFDHLDHFQMVRPHNKDAYDLATDILRNRLNVLQAENIVHLKDRSEQLARVRHEKDKLQERFEALLRHWIEFGWPVNQGRAKVDKHTPVPPVDGKYELPLTEETTEIASGDDAVVWGEKTHRIWDSFTLTLSDTLDKDPRSISTIHRRLSLLKKLAKGEEIAKDRSLPHILGDSLYLADKTNTNDVNDQRERCWKTLLLPPEDLGFQNEWELVQDHFNNSRSKKVLSIIQKK